MRKDERVVLLTTADFKAVLTKQAVEEGVSVSELVRRRIEGRPSKDEELLVQLTQELRERVARTEARAERVFREVDQLLAGMPAAGERAKEAA